MAVLKVYDGTTFVEISGTSDPDAIHGNVSGEIAAIAEKTAPVAADLLLLEDSAASNAKKRLQIGNLAAVLDDEYIRRDGAVPLIAPWAANNDITGLTKLVVDSLTLDGTTIQSSAALDLIATTALLRLTGSSFVLRPSGIGGDVLLTFDALAQDGTLTYRNTEDEFRFGSGSVVVIPGIGDGGYTNYDLKVGSTATPTYGMIQFGNAVIGRTSFKGGAIDLDGTIMVRNIGGPVTSEIEFIWTESAGDTCRFALPKSAVGNATYNSRSMLLAGPAPADTDFVKVTYWQGQGIFDNLACDTSGDGADLGVQNDLEVEGEIYTDDILESTTGAGVTIEGVVLDSGLVDGRDIAADGALLDTALQSPLSANLDFSKFKAVAMVADNGATLPAAPTKGQWFLHTPIGRTILYMYDGSTWAPIISLGSMTVFVDKTDGADDQNGGTAVDGDAFATIQFAVDQIPGLVGGNVVININNETYAESVTVQGKSFAGNYNILFEGQWAEQLSETTASGGTAGSATLQGTLTVTGTPWSANAFQYMWVKFEDDTTTAILRGQELLINANGASTITFLNAIDAAPVSGDTFTIVDHDTEWGMAPSGTEPMLRAEQAQTMVDCHRIYFLETTEVPTLWMIDYLASSSGRWDACKLTEDTRLLCILIRGGSLFLQDCFIDGARSSGTRSITLEDGAALTINHTLVRTLSKTTGANRSIYAHSNSIVNFTGGLVTRAFYGLFQELGASSRFSGSGATEGRLRVNDCDVGLRARGGGLIGITNVILTGNTTDEDPAGASDPSWIT